MTAVWLGKSSRSLLVPIFGIAVLSRTAAAIVLPNAEQDGYSYAEMIANLTQQFEHGHFHLSDLFGFWLPLFQIASAVVNLWFHDPMVAGKIVNVFCGA